MPDLVTTLQASFASINLGVAGGVLLFLDMILFSALAAFWEPGGRVRLRSTKK